MKDKKNETNNNLKEAEELKKIVNNSSNELIKNLTNIFSATKFESSNLKSGNVDIYINMDSMANEINSLLNVVNKLKIKELKKKNHLKETQQKIEEILNKKKKKKKEKNLMIIYKKQWIFIKILIMNWLI